MSMGMVRCCDDHRVDALAHLVEHLAVIVVTFDGRILRGDGGSRALASRIGPPVYIAERYDILTLQIAEADGRAAADADHRDVELFAGRSRSSQPENMGGENRESSSRRRGANQVAP